MQLSPAERYTRVWARREAEKLTWTRSAQRPVWHVDKPNKTGARSARARTRGQNPLVVNNSVADPHHVDADLDPDPTFHFDAGPDLLVTLMRIRSGSSLTL